MPAPNSLYYRWPRWTPQVGDIAVRRYPDPLTFRVCAITQVALDDGLHRGGLIETVEWDPVHEVSQRRVVFPDQLEYVGGLDSLGVKLIERNNDDDQAE